MQQQAPAVGQVLRIVPVEPFLVLRKLEELAAVLTFVRNSWGNILLVLVLTLVSSTWLYRRTYKRADLLREADHIFIEELHRQKLYDETSQAFAVFLPVRSVGVMGDGRRYDYVIALRAVETIDFMTARWARLPYEFLEHVSLRIINEVDGISRVTYDISGKPPATIEWE